MVQAVSGRVLATSLLAVGMFGAHARGAHDATINVSLSVAADLTDVARHALLGEVESIWREAGVQLRWGDANDTDAAEAGLRVRVVRRQVSTPAPDTWVVGELLRFDDGHAVAIASIPRAEAVVRAAGSGRAHGVPDSIVQHRLGTVLGRAVAHEIGHYLLDDGTHASHGLMRARFQPREFTDLRSGTFLLDVGSQRRIQERLGTTVTTIARAGRRAPAGATPSILHR
jgi:hypothetical protein